MPPVIFTALLFFTLFGGPALAAGNSGNAYKLTDKILASTWLRGVRRGTTSKLGCRIRDKNTETNKPFGRFPCPPSGEPYAAFNKPFDRCFIVQIDRSWDNPKVYCGLQLTKEAFLVRDGRKTRNFLEGDKDAAEAINRARDARLKQVTLTLSDDDFKSGVLDIIGTDNNAAYDKIHNVKLSDHQLSQLRDVLGSKKKEGRVTRNEQNKFWFLTNKNSDPRNAADRHLARKHDSQAKHNRPSAERTEEQDGEDTGGEAGENADKPGASDNKNHEHPPTQPIPGEPAKQKTSQRGEKTGEKAGEGADKSDAPDDKTDWDAPIEAEEAQRLIDNFDWSSMWDKPGTASPAGGASRQASEAPQQRAAPAPSPAPFEREFNMDDPRFDRHGQDSPRDPGAPPYQPGTPARTPGSPVVTDSSSSDSSSPPSKRRRIQTP